MSELFLLTIGVFWLGGAAVNSLIATEKGRNSGLCLVLSLVFSPLLVWMYLVAVPPKQDQQRVKMPSNSSVARGERTAADNALRSIGMRAEEARAKNERHTSGT